MEEILNQLIDTSTIPLFTALLLGLLTSVSPCTFTTNVMVLAFIGKDVEDGKRSFMGVSSPIPCLVCFVSLSFEKGQVLSMSRPL